MFFTYEEILERKRSSYLHPFDFAYVVVNNKGNIVYFDKGEKLKQWVIDNCYKKNNLYNSSWQSRIFEWIEDSIKKQRKYKGYRFYYYDKKWERKFKISKLLKNERIIKV